MAAGAPMTARTSAAGLPVHGQEYASAHHDCLLKFQPKVYAGEYTCNVCRSNGRGDVYQSANRPRTDAGVCFSLEEDV